MSKDTIPFARGPIKVKLHNRRVVMGRTPDGDYWMFFKKLEDRKSRKIKETILRLSENAMNAVMAGYLRLHGEGVVCAVLKSNNRMEVFNDDDDSNPVD